MINITSPGHLNCGCKVFTFSIGERNFKEYSDKHCDVCGIKNLNIGYVEIIDKLKEAKLIPDDYPLLCCMCYYTRILFGF